MRLLCRLLIILALCSVAIVLPLGPAQALDRSITLTPDKGVPGEDVIVRGTNLTENVVVDIYYYPNGERIWVADVETAGDGDFRGVHFDVPESHKGEHDVRVYLGTNLQATAKFTVEPGLRIDTEEGPIKTLVTVQGLGFAEDEEDIELRYYLNSNHEVIEDGITADENGSWDTSFHIPSSTEGYHNIDARGANSRLYEVHDAVFKVTPGITIDKSSGSVGDEIEMTGSGFESEERDITILFDGQAVATEIRADETGYWEGSFDVPEMPAGEYSVTAEGEQTPREDISALTFEIEPDLLLSPDRGHVGTNLTVTGRGFAADKNVVIEYDETEVEELTGTPRTNDDGIFEVSFEVPESKHGEQQLTAEDAAGNNGTAIFRMESVSPDMPDLISPADGDRMGFIGKVKPTFEWSEVSDDSGVYYNLRIWPANNVTDAGESVDPIVERWAGTNYTLKDIEALPQGTYYWSVQAVDGADNESGWTEARSFRIGVMPLWAFVIIVVVAAGGIGAVVYFRVIRQRIYYY